MDAVRGIPDENTLLYTGSYNCTLILIIYKNNNNNSLLVKSEASFNIAYLCLQSNIQSISLFFIANQ